MRDQPIHIEIGPELPEWAQVRPTAEIMAEFPDFFRPIEEFVPPLPLQGDSMTKREFNERPLVERLQDPFEDVFILDDDGNPIGPALTPEAKASVHEAILRGEAQGGSPLHPYGFDGTAKSLGM